MRTLICSVATAMSVCAWSTDTLAADPFADAVIEYTPGTNPATGFTDASTALGEPSRFTTGGFDPGVVNTFRGAAQTDQVVSIGAGGSLTVRFDEPVTDDPLNPFGIDLLVFGNAFLFTEDFTPGSPVAGVFGEGGIIEVSADGISWAVVPGVDADALYPTLGYSDLTDGADPTPGAVETDFTRPVDPAFDPTGLLFGDVVAGYQGSGGGAGVDLASVGLGAISYVRVSTPVGAAGAPEIDAFADVRAIPAPATPFAVGLAAIGGRRRRTERTTERRRAPHG